MNECIIKYGDRFYIAKNLTSYTNITLLYTRDWFNLYCRYEKEFSFGGDKLIISEPFVINRFKHKKIFNRILKGWKKTNYPDLSWLEYIHKVAEETETTDHLIKVVDQSQTIVDLLNDWKHRGLI